MTMNLPAASPPTTATSRKTGAKERLLTATRELMIERNSLEFSLHDIAAKSGLNSALVKYHFGSKDGLLLNVVKQDASASITQLEKLIAMRISATAKMKTHIAGIINTYFHSPYLNRLLHQLLHNRDATASQEIYEFFVEPLIKCQRLILDEGIASGEFKPVDPTLFYFSLIGACDYLFHAHYSMRATFKIDRVDDDVRRRYIDHVTNLVLGGILNEPQSQSV